MMNIVLQVINFMFAESLDSPHVFHILYLEVEFIKFANFEKSLDYHISCFKSFFPIRILWSKFLINGFPICICALDSLLPVDLD